jgi:hypothetical protein
MKVEYKNIIKQIVEATNNKIVFIGSFTDTLRGVSDSFGDVDIIIKEEDLKSLEIFGDIIKAGTNPLFKGMVKYYIKNETVAIDIFIGDTLSGAIFETILLDDIPLTVFTIDSEIAELEKIIAIDFNPKYKDKLLERILKLSKYKNK